ncbi:VirB3 family type IV secretion system protein [uncultured Ruegeria sp.]|uniref:VirB3 family type IV secretion system protein n=1 Tax=uncultured Ruegeria sp. TaxID=259304 RepID=UPI002609D35E|nr:VirB3 family type IV secretion system protein [uncultured Ruegeria sp.]
MNPTVRIKTLSRSRHLAGAERVPVILALMLSAVIVVAVFGVTPSGVVVGIVIFLGQMKYLRDIAVYDPQYFRIMWKRIRPMRLPRRLPRREVLFRPAFLQQKSN